MEALTLVVVAEAGTGGGYFWGRGIAAADIQATTVELTSATLQHCTGPATWTDHGRRACALPLWLDTPTAEPPGSRKLTY